MTSKRLPQALVKRAQALAKQKIARILTAARKDIALIREKRDDITAAFYDIGEALVRLRRPEVHKAFAFPSWERFCAKELGMSATQAARLIDIVTSMTRQEALRLGTSTKASSVAELIAATPEVETVGDAIRHGVHIGKGRRIDVTHASTRAIAAATKHVRAATVGKGTRGRGTSASERRIAGALAKRLDALGIKARVILKAGLVRQEARIAIEVPISALSSLRKALATS